MKCFWIFFHDWSKWQGFVRGFRVGWIWSDKYQETYENWQRRTCAKCGLIEEKEV